MKRRTLLIAGAAGLVVVAAVVTLGVTARPMPVASGPLPAAALARGLGDGAHPTASPTATPAAPAAAPEAPPAAPPATPSEPEVAAPPAAAAAPDSAEGEVLDLANAQRAANGCGPLAADEGLASVAREHSADMAARDYFSHTTPEGVDPFQRAAAAGQSAMAENIAAGQGSAAAVMDSWMNSPGHRANILNCSLTRLGVGVGYGGSYGIYWTQLFG